MYDFLNEKTGEIESHMMSISKLDEFKQENPHLQQRLFGAPSTVRSSGGFKNDDGWKENLARISEAHPHSTLAEKQGGRSSSKAKVSEVAKKHGLNNKGSYKMDL